MVVVTMRQNYNDLKLSSEKAEPADKPVKVKVGS